MEHHPDDPQILRYLLQQLNQRVLAYLHTGMFDDALRYTELGETVTSFLRRLYHGKFVG